MCKNDINDNFVEFENDIICILNLSYNEEKFKKNKTYIETEKFIQKLIKRDCRYKSTNRKQKRRKKV